MELSYKEDTEIHELKELIQDGWPKDRRHLRKNLRIYWPYRDELTLYEGIIYKVLATLIPDSVKTMIMRKLHAAHLGVGKMIWMARDNVFWPTIRNDLYNT